MHQIAADVLDFDIDRLLNPYIPRNRLSYLPTPLSRLLGYRPKLHKEPPAVVQWFFTFIGVFTGLLLVGAIFRYASAVTVYNPPVIIASLGAGAVLDFGAIRTPLAQPRNALFGQALSAFVGVAISKLFQLNSGFNDLLWIAGPVSCACASLLMSITNTTHPPGGATAVIATTQTGIIEMGWRFVPLVLIGSTVMLSVALLINNIARQYPVYWWSPADVGSKLEQKNADTADAEKDAAGGDGSDEARHDSTSCRWIQD